MSLLKNPQCMDLKKLWANISLSPDFNSRNSGVSLYELAGIILEYATGVGTVCGFRSLAEDSKHSSQTSGHHGGSHGQGASTHLSSSSTFFIWLACLIRALPGDVKFRAPADLKGNRCDYWEACELNFLKKKKNTKIEMSLENLLEHDKWNMRGKLCQGILFLFSSMPFSGHCHHSEWIEYLSLLKLPTKRPPVGQACSSCQAYDWVSSIFIFPFFWFS